MLRVTLLLLLLANAAYFTWSQGLLAAWGVAPAQQAEPHRLQQQIKPQALRLVAADEARRLELARAPAFKAPECLQAGPFEDAQATALRLAMAPWPAGSWTLESAVEPARWIVYMGKYPTTENVARKRFELRQIGVSFETPLNPELEPGLSLGAFPTETAAMQLLDTLTQKGVRTARVVQERAEVRGQMLKLAAVDESIRPRLDDLNPVLNGKNLRPCR